MISIPISQSFRFRPVTGRISNFDNTFDCLNTVNDKLIIPYQNYYDIDNYKIQIQTDAGVTGTIILIYSDGVRTDVPFDGAITTINDINYLEQTLNFTAYAGKTNYMQLCEVTIDGIGDPLFETEPFYVKQKSELYAENYLKFEWFNQENAFMINYSSGIVNRLYVNCELLPDTPGGEVHIFTNQGRSTKVKEIVTRVFNIETELPAYLCELLAIAMAHDRFYINETEFIVDKKANYQQIGNSSLFKFTANIQQRIIIGLNTHDTGFNCD